MRVVHPPLNDDTSKVKEIALENCGVGIREIVETSIFLIDRFNTFSLIFWLWIVTILSTKIQSFAKPTSSRVKAVLYNVTENWNYTKSFSFAKDCESTLNFYLFYS